MQKWRTSIALRNGYWDKNNHTQPQLMPSKIYRCRHVGLMRIDRKWKSWEESIRHQPCTVVDCRFGSAALSVWWTQSISHVFPYHSHIIPLSSRVCHLFLHLRHFPDTCVSRHIWSNNIQPISFPTNILEQVLLILSIKHKRQSKGYSNLVYRDRKREKEVLDLVKIMCGGNWIIFKCELLNP